MTKTIRHKALGIDIQLSAVTQKMLEDFNRTLRQDDTAEVSFAEFSGATVRAAAAAGWLVGIAEEDVDQMSPAAVRFIAAELNEYYSEITTVPENL